MNLPQVLKYLRSLFPVLLLPLLPADLSGCQQQDKGPSDAIIQAAKTEVLAIIHSVQKSHERVNSTPELRESYY